MVLICSVAFLAALLTFFSGFGLGTLLTPVMAIYFPIDQAILITGVVHFFNNLFKLFLVGGKADKQTLIRFAIPAVIAALAGSAILLQLSALPTAYSYEWNGKQVEVPAMNLVIGILLMLFAALDIIPGVAKLAFDRKWLPVGGVLSGFFGGLSGHQGALRSAFLVRTGLSKEAFVATAVVISTCIDFTRLGIYATGFRETGLGAHGPLIIAASLSAMTGAFIGNKLLKKVTIRFLQIVVAITLFAIALLLMAGII